MPRWCGASTARVVLGVPRRPNCGYSLVRHKNLDAGTLHQDEQPFWKTKTLDEMSAAEWESLCDGCGRCCLVKLEDEDNGDIYLTKLSCGLLNVRTCKCRDYENRFAKMPDCLQIDIAKARELPWLPASCAYRVLAEGRELAWWHPLISGTAETVHQAGVSVRSFAMSERRVKEENYMRYIIPDFTGEPGTDAGVNDQFPKAR